MFEEVGITPEVFKSTAFHDSRFHWKVLHDLGPLLQHRVFVRNAAAGRWRKALIECSDDLPWEAKVLIADIERRGRLFADPRSVASEPGCEEEWLRELILSARETPLRRIYCADNLLANRYETDGVFPAERENGVIFMETTVHIRRSRQDFLRCFGRLLGHAAWIILADPYFAPWNERRYGGFLQVLRDVSWEIAPRPQIEIHRAELTPDEDHEAKPAGGMRAAFKQLGKKLQKIGLRGTAFVWPRRRWKREGGFPLAPAFGELDVSTASAPEWGRHDRYLLTNLGSCVLSNGFDEKPEAEVAVSLLGPKAASDVCDWFHPNRNYPVDKIPLTAC